jgi:CHAD domain-containing protein
MSPDSSHDKQQVRSPPFKITADCAAREAVIELSAGMLATARGYEECIVNGEDVECLHQYRVSLRKTRSLISLLKQVYPSELQLSIKQRLAALSARSNELRDLDVYLQDWGDYVDMLPEHLHVGMMAMFVDFESRQREEKQKLARWLKSADYLQEMEWLETVFSRGYLVAETPVSEKPVYPLVTKKLRKHYRKVCRLGCAITPDTPDQQLHQLRIECKKLRYLLDFFGPLYEKKCSKQLLTALKKLQDTLGRFNDYAVQQAFLRRYMENNRAQPELVGSVQALLAIFKNRFSAVRGEIQPAFKAFASEETAQRVKRLLNPA